MFIDEIEILNTLTDLESTLCLPIPEDVRKSLPQNPYHKWSKRNAKIKGMCWHQALGGDTVLGIAKYHASPGGHLNNGKGVQTFSYTWGIEKTGKIYLCNDFESKTWSQGTSKILGDENADYMAVCFCGNFNHSQNDKLQEPTYAQMLSGLILWQVCQNHFSWNESELKGHFDFGKPSCPGVSLETMIRAGRKNIKLGNKIMSDKDKQKALKTLGFNLVVDGKIGPRTIMKIKQFQTKYGLVADGIWGAKTQLMINKLLGTIL